MSGLEIAFGIGGLAMGVGTTILGVKAGLVSKGECRSCNLQQMNSIEELKDDVRETKDDIKETKKDIKGLYGKQDEINASLKEIIGYLKGKGEKL